MKISFLIIPLFIIVSIFSSCEKDAPSITQQNISITDSLVGNYSFWHTYYTESDAMTPTLDSFYNDTLKITKINSDTIEVDVLGTSYTVRLGKSSLTSPDSVVFDYKISNYASRNEKKLIYHRPTMTITYYVENASWSISGPQYSLNKTSYYQN